MNVFNNEILARNGQFPEDDRMIETCRSIFKSCNVNNLSVCIGWCADQVTYEYSSKLCPENSSVAKIKQHIPMCNKFFFESRGFCENVEKYGKARQATGDNIIRRMQVSCWITKATDRHLEYTISTAFIQQ